ncbi:hypothetical protein PT974_06482 [Cladobotryum mycophilum]|uniref:Uncharacterized protein n=1 Tax=Cladobotryum mycophilum TaxID=491253 RepID=A0ABR0SLL8_9HYPO
MPEQPKKKPTSAAMDPQFAAIVADAAKQYADSSSKASKLDDFLTPPMKSVNDLIQQLSLQNDNFVQFRAKRQNIFDAIATALGPVEVIGEIVAGASEEAFPPAQHIFSAVMYLVNAAHDVTSMYDSIIELFVKLKDFTSRLDVYVQHAMTPALREKMVSILAVLFEVLVISTQAARQGRFKTYFKRLIGSESPARPALEKLDALTISEERQVIAETYGGVAQINAKTDRVEGIVSQVSQSIQMLRLEQRDRMSATHRDKLRDILEPSPFAEDFYTAFSKSRIPGTGDWLIEDEGLKAWFQGETRYLWMCGSPGTGKSFLTTRLITWGLENLPQIAYFFFRDTDPETRSVLQALRDIAYQLTETDAYYAEKLMRQLHSTDDIKTVASAFRRLFIQPFADDKREKTVYIFLDGIDEANQGEVEELLSLLAPEEDGPLPAPEQKIQFALIGRSYLTETVASALDPNGHGQVFTTILVTPDRSENDVAAFIKDGVRRSRILSRSTDRFKKDVVEAMKKQVDGLFILAKFMLTEINHKRHPSSILNSLESFPKEINGMLNKTLTNLAATVSEEEARDLNEMLQWVACAEESLTLEQLEAALILVFGDPPLRLEEELRGQYACFFELERADGLTTDDLIKDFAKKQREMNPERNVGRTMSPNGRLSSPGSSSPSSGVSPSPNRQPSPGVRALSPARSPGMLDYANEMDYRSPSNTKVTFFHNSVRQFFREGASATPATNGQSMTIGFDIVDARVHILKICLRIFIDKPWFEKQKLGHGKEAIKQYAAWYWQEHLAVLDPASVPPSDRRELGMQIYKMLTDDNTLFDWSIMYEKNNEGLEVLTDSNINGLRKWLNDPIVFDSLTPEAKECALKAKGKALGICEPIGRYYAKAWLSMDCREYVPTLFCFKIVQNMALMDAGHGWSEAGAMWKDLAIQERMSKATEWANYPKTAHWYLRIGSTYLMLGMYANALEHYQEALELQKDSVQIAGRIAFCYSKYGQFSKALDQALRCAEIEKKSLSDGKLQGFALNSCKWRLYKDYLLVARCYYRTGEVDAARGYFLKAVESAADVDLGPLEYCEVETEYIGMLAAENLHDDMMNLISKMASQSIGSTNGKSRLIDLFLDHYTKPLVLDWIPKAACKAGKADFILDQLEVAINLAQAIRDPIAVLYLRIAYGITCAYHRDIDGAIKLFEKISLDEYRPRGNVPTRQGHALSFQKLANLYKQKVLQFDINSKTAHDWIAKLEAVQEKQSKHQNLDMPADMFGSDVNVASIYLASLYTALGRNLEANTLLRKLVLSSLDILLDDEPRNDEYALENLLRAFIAADDIANALALAQSMRKVNPKATLPTPTESPVHTRIQPKLPDIQSANRNCAQCLNNTPPWEEFVLCRFCLDSYCVKCLEGLIKKPGNKTADGRADVSCRSDHEWFIVPPLNKFLHRGEILWGDGQVKVFTEWESGLRRIWRGLPHEESLASTISFWLD